MTDPHDPSSLSRTLGAITAEQSTGIDRRTFLKAAGTTAVAASWMGCAPSSTDLSGSVVVIESAVVSTPSTMSPASPRAADR